jgi:hypothetical protein
MAVSENVVSPIQAKTRLHSVEERERENYAKRKRIHFVEYIVAVVVL